MTEHDASASGAERAGGFREFTFLQGKRVRAHDTAHGQPPDDAEPDVDTDQTAGSFVEPRDAAPNTGWFARKRSPQIGHDDDDEEQRGDGVKHVDGAHDGGVGPAPEVARDQPSWHADEHDDGLHDDPDGQRDARAEDEADQDVAAELVGAHRMRPTRTLRDRGVVLLGVGVPVELRHDDRNKRQRDEKERRNHGQPIAAQAMKGAGPEPIGLLGCGFPQQARIGERGGGHQFDIRGSSSG